MTFRKFLKYVILPLILISAIIFLLYHKPIIRYFSFNSKFDKLIKYRGRNVALDYANEIIKMGKEAEDPLIEKAKSSYTTNVEKYYALYFLGRIHSKKAIPLLLKGLKAIPATVRLGAIRGLKYEMAPEYVKALRELIYDPVRDIRYEVAEALGKVNTRESKNLLYVIVKKERDQLIWERAWHSLRIIEKVDGFVVDKFRMNRYFQIMKKDDLNNEVGYTYFFLTVKEGTKTKVINVRRKFWAEVKVGDHIKKPSMSENFVILESKK